MDNRYFNILGHATGRLLLKRPGYEIDVDRVIDHARRNGCFFEINSSPDRLILPAENARGAAAAGGSGLVAHCSYCSRSARSASLFGGMSAASMPKPMDLMLPNHPFRMEVSYRAWIVAFMEK